MADRNDKPAAASLPENAPPPEIKYHVMRRKTLYFVISGILMIPAIAAIILCIVKFGTPVKLGIDFQGGSLMQVRFERPVKADEFRTALAKVRVDGHKIEGEIQDVIETAQRTATGGAEVGSSLILRTHELKPKEIDQLKSRLADPALGLGAFTTERVETVGPKIGAELIQNALIALAAGIILILAYISFRYQFDFAMCGIAAMVHDVVIMVGAFAIMSLTLGAEADGLFITALLTVMGFSVHDTIVIFDRIRENLRFAQKGDTFADVADRSINQTFARSIYTSLTTVLALLPIVLFGGSTLFFFTLTMVIGIVSGTYSSIFNAAPLLVVWRDRRASST
ncbi:MAG: protein translocase subunit SecF [Candidatus Sericytochromatia bacterium]|nr:protein translocase subunit SecF [Candidatus Tanganyikabacteria bacterium]